MDRDEVWRSAQGYEGLYEVSSLGRVRSLERDAYRKDGTRLRLKAAVKRSTRNGAGYLHVRLTKDGISTNALVHRLVAEAFAKNPGGGSFVNHKDLDTEHNDASNLEWVSHRGNIVHARDAGRLNGGTNPRRRFKLSPSRVSEIRERCRSGESRSSIASDHGISERMVTHIDNGTRWPMAFDSSTKPEV